MMRFARSKYRCPWLNQFSFYTVVLGIGDTIIEFSGVDLHRCNIINIEIDELRCNDARLINLFFIGS